MDKTIAWSLISLTLSGLAFLTYKHPIVARKIIKVAGSILIGLVLLTASYHFGQEDAFDKSNEVFDFNEIHPPVNLLNFDSIGKSKIANTDTMIDILKRNVIEMEKERSVYVSNLKTLKDFKLAIAKSQIETHFNAKMVFYYEMFFGTMLLLFLLLSYTFENLWKPKSKEQNNAPHETS